MNQYKVKHDNYTTPKSAWEEIAHLIPKDKCISDPFYCNGSSGMYLRELGFECIHNNEDFFLHNRGDIVVSNPPFTIKKQILQRLVKLEKPFILLH